MQNSAQGSSSVDGLTPHATLSTEDFQNEPHLKAHSQSSREVARALDSGEALPVGPLGNIVYRLDPLLVMDSVNQAVSAIRQNQQHWLQRDKDIQAAHDADVAANRKPPRYAPPKTKEREIYTQYRIDLETQHYATVQVVQLGGVANKFVLVYGNTDPATALTGTGPFKTFEEAAGWFYRGGR